MFHTFVLKKQESAPAPFPHPSRHISWVKMQTMHVYFKTFCFLMVLMSNYFANFSVLPSSHAFYTVYLCILTIYLTMIRKMYPIANSYGAVVGTLDNRISEHIKRYCMLSFNDDDHPFHDFISKLPFGSICAYRCACGSNSFIRHYINFINTVIAGSRE